MLYRSAPHGAVLMISLLTLAQSPAWANSRQPSLAYGPTHAAAVVHGTVFNVQSCVSNNQSSAWTFVTLTVHNTLVGDLVPAPGQPANRHTVRFKLGTYADETTGGLGGTPKLVVGDEVVMLLRKPSTGTPLVPISLAGDGIYRIIQLGGGATAVVDGDGLLVLATASGLPVLGPRIAHAEGNFPPGNPIDPPAAITEILEAQSYSVTYAGSPLIGTWKMSARFMVDDPVQITTQSGTQVPNIKGRCTADLFGAYDGQQLTMTGKCLAPYIGNVDVELTGSIVAGRWRGQLTLVSQHPAEEEVVFAWESPPLVAADADRIRGTVTQLVSVTPEAPSNITLIQPVADEIGLLGGWVGGIRPLMTRAAFLNWLDTTAADAGNAGFAVPSTPLSSARCNQTFMPQLALEGGAE